MARLISREFNPTTPVHVRRFFVAAGRHWNPGDLFDWPRLSVAQRRVKQLFDAGKLMHANDGGEIAGPGDTALMGEKPSEQTRIAEPASTLPPTAAATAASAATPQDELDDLNMKELRVIAEREGAPSRVSRESQRDAIRETRRGKN